MKGESNQILFSNYSNKQKMSDQIFFLVGEIEKQEEELVRLEQQVDSNGSLEEQVRKLRECNTQMRDLMIHRRRLLDQLRSLMMQHATEERPLIVGEHLIIRELRTISSRLDRLAEDTTCSICLEPLRGDGAHFLVSLRCGHLFGSNCIHTAIRRYHRCPICRRRARHSDVRRIYGRTSSTP
ncbi:E3 ubiquitin-protein ligase rnf8-B [Drosophila takahashii]|uniref:E3 ubiquitin-protein ligase rnf8-B n=1 Tax=Drosophila takahashii TaxID=29030 RepID=UPI001CF817ED|nr:E3 ubiquitin-protein ligase rnf8-B [Drosophila takahashii]